nr:MAG TPA: hypothetical protein [Crassvirales sp.]
MCNTSPVFGSTTSLSYEASTKVLNRLEKKESLGLADFSPVIGFTTACV